MSQGFISTDESMSLLSFEIKIQLSLFFNPRSLSCVGSSEPNQMLESYFVAGASVS